AMLDAIVIGAGWAGLAAADVLKQAGMQVLVVEKSRGPGGRSATRREGRVRFDHGAQYFTARGGAFARRLQHWKDAGWVEPWRPRLAVLGGGEEHGNPEEIARFVAVPGMNGVCRRLADSLECRFGTRIERLEYDRFWRVHTAKGEVLESSRLLLTAPAPQAADLLGAEDPLSGALRQIRFDPCLAGMVSFSAPIEVEFDAAFVNLDLPLAWVARNSSKPGRENQSWVLHATPAWSRQHLEKDSDTFAAELLAAFAELVPAALPEPRSLLGHRWRYALATNPREDGLIADADRRLVIAGDWLSGNRIEGAWTSGRKAGRWLAE
ncbi:MAG: NAD(P)/FAD-dependent oxidoreductase, partial [Wenzhouxiangellaceae bacterium]